MVTREYYRAHREKIKRSSREYYYKHRDERIKYSTDYWKLHPNKHREHNRKYASKPETKAMRKDYNRKHVLHLRDKNGYMKRVTGLNKRPRPSLCELCNREKTYLAYHHWDNSNLNIGLWLCNRCHLFAEIADKKYMLYCELKEKARKEVEKYAPESRFIRN